MSATNKETVIRKRPNAFLHGWRDVFNIYAPQANGQPPNDVLGAGKTPALAWADAAKNLKGKRKRTWRTRREHRAVVSTHREEAKRRGRQRRELAQRLGAFVLNELEITGSVSIRDYTTMTPRMVLSMYQSRRPS